MGVFGVFFGCRGVVGFNGCCSWVSSGDGGFMLARVSGCEGVGSFVYEVEGVGSFVYEVQSSITKESAQQ